jgi:hypothetical protein
MEGNPFLNFLWQSAIELPAFIIGKLLGKSFLMDFFPSPLFRLVVISIKFKNKIVLNKLKILTFF